MKAFAERVAGSVFAFAILSAGALLLVVVAGVSTFSGTIGSLGRSQLAAVVASSAYPADIGPVYPVIVYGTTKLRSSYAGSALEVARQAPAMQATIGFSGDTLHTSSLDSFLGTTTGKVVTWFDQVGAHNATQGISQAPKIRHLSIGGHRAVVFEGGTQSGAIDALTFSLAGLDLESDSYSIVAVVEPTTSLPRNQAIALGPVDYTFLSLESASSSVVARAFAKGSGGAPSWALKDDTFSFVAPTQLIEISPSVVGWISGPSGTEVWVNESKRSTSAHSAASLEAVMGYIGKKGSSVPGGTSEAFDGRVVALLIYDSAISGAQRADVFQSLYQRFNINTARDKNTISFVGDSIAAGYVAFGLNGLHFQLMPLLSTPARIANFAIPGSTITPQSPGTFTYAYTQGIFNEVVGPYGQASTERNILVVFGGGNDGLIVPQPSAQTVYNGILDVVAKGKAAGFNPVFVCTLLPRDAWYQPLLEGINSRIRADGGANFRLCDLAADSRLYPHNYTYYADQGHLNEAGGGIVASILAPLMNQALSEPPPVPTPSCVINAAPGTIVQGATTTLSWTSQNAQAAMIAIPATFENIPVSVNGTLAKPINVLGTVGFDLYVANGGGFTKCTTSITVVSPPSCTITATPATIVKGATTTLSWTSQNAQAAMIAIPATLENIPSPVNGTLAKKLNVAGTVGIDLYVAAFGVDARKCSVSVQVNP